MQLETGSSYEDGVSAIMTCLSDEAAVPGVGGVRAALAWVSLCFGRRPQLLPRELHF